MHANPADQLRQSPTPPSQHSRLRLDAASPSSWQLQVRTRWANRHTEDAFAGADPLLAPARFAGASARGHNPRVQRVQNPDLEFGWTFVADPLREQRPANERFAQAKDAGGLRLLGIDPGLQRTGYAVLEWQPHHEGHLIEAGLIRLARAEPLAQRLCELERSLAEIIEAQSPTTLACEELYAHYKHPRTAILMGHARGVILALAARMNLAVLSIASTHAKKLLTGCGHAKKHQVQQAVASLLNLPTLPEPHDVADAIAIGLAGIRAHQAALLLAEANA